jgi:hypothetical protein
MRVYLSASWKQRERVRALAEALRDEGHEVYDFTDPRCRKTPEIPPEAFPLQFDPERETYREYITGNPYYKAAVHSNYEAIEWCDVVLLLLPAGCDSHADWALGVGMRKKSAVVGQPKAGDRTPSHLWCDQFLDRDEDVSGWLETLELEMPMRSRRPDLRSAAERLAGEVEYLHKQRAAIGSRCVDSLARVLDEISEGCAVARPSVPVCTPRVHAPGCSTTDSRRVARDCQPRVSAPTSFSCASGSCATCNHGGPDGVPCGHECHQEGAGA